MNDSKIYICACLRTLYQPIKNQDGTYTPRWVCQDCGAMFVKYSDQDAEICEDCGQLHAPWKPCRYADTANQPKLNDHPLGLKLYDGQDDLPARLRDLAENCLKVFEDTTFRGCFSAELFGVAEDLRKIANELEKEG